MRRLSDSYNLQLTSKLLLANTMASLAFFVIAGCILLAFAAVRSQSASIASTDIDYVVRNSTLTRELSRVFFEMDSLDRTFLRNSESLDSEAQRLSVVLTNAQAATTEPGLEKSLAAVSLHFGRLTSQGQLVNDLAQQQNQINREMHADLTEVESIISEWLIESTLAGNDTDFVTQLLTLVAGFRESLLNIDKLHAKLDIDVSVGATPTPEPLMDAIDDLALRFHTITASSASVAQHGRLLIDKAREYRNVVERLIQGVVELNSLRTELASARTGTLSEMSRIDSEIRRTAYSSAGRIEEIVTWAGALVVMSTVATIVLVFFAARRLITRHVRAPMQTVLDGIEAVGGGDLRTRVILDRNDEWGVIGRALNEMTAALDSSQKALQESNLKLERRVDERTRELADAVEALSSSESTLIEAQRIAHLGHWSWDFETGRQTWSEELYRIFGLQPFEVEPSYELFVDFLHPEDSVRMQQSLRDAVQGNSGIATEYRIVTGDGNIRWVETQLKAGRREGEGPPEVSGTVLDITARKRVERLLMEEKERVLVTLHSIGDAVISTDGRGMLEYLNPVAERLTGHELDDVRGKPLKHVFRIVNEETREPADDPVARCLREGKVMGLANHTLLLSKSGAEYAIQDSAAPIKDSTGAVLGVVLVFSDVTEARRLSRQISHEARHDGLTSLPNRQEFKRRLERVVETARAESTQNALCYLDLDQFKLINDTCGHVAGDEVLRQVSALLADNVRHRDTLARLGGDEFGLLMELRTLDEAQHVTGKLIEEVSAHEFLWEENRFRVGLSIGLVAVNELCTDANRLLMAADAACLLAKEQGRNRSHVFHENDEELAKRHGEMQWAVRIPRAMEEGSFRLYVQPIVPLAGNADEGAHYEVLIRLDGDRLVLPGVFFPAADRYQLSSRLDRWVIDKVFRWLAAHPEHLRALHLCAINLSGHSLNEPEFLDFMTRQFEESPIPPEKICLEITETVAVANLAQATGFMNALKQMGCRFALDDFGSGLSSFAYLKTLPVEFLKIDGLFVKDILNDPLDLALVKSINEIGKVLGMKTIAEFVEDEQILGKIREVGVDYAQGFAVGDPRPIDDLLH
jgi:diguanylate cyclase (GGDEF)-like protein/PAS domain S-box-containing protein